MDIFKLLARSTNLHKSGSNTDPTLRQSIPSAGLISGAQRISSEGDHITTLLPDHKVQGTKRKRISNNEAQQHNVHSERLNAREARTSVPENGKALVVDGKLSGSVIHHDNPIAHKSTAERRQILKQNKLKITVLEDGRQAKRAKLVDQAGDERARKSKKDLRSQLYPEPLTSFKHLRSRYKISKRLSENLDAQGYRYPTEVQLGSLPILLGSEDDLALPDNKKKTKKKVDGRKTHLDLLTIAPTGSGKTLAFMINVIHHLLEERGRARKLDEACSSSNHVQALIIAPTHELVDQIVNEGKKLALGTGIRISAMKKGMTVQTDAPIGEPKALQRLSSEAQGGSIGDEPEKVHPAVKADILVSTPMLLVNAMSENQSTTSKSLPSVRYLVLDEADVLLDPLFRDQTLSIWNACTNPSLQTTFWSATIGSSIESLVQSTILNRRKTLGITLPHLLIRVVVGLKDSAIPNVIHRLTYAATEQGKLLALRQILHPTAPSEDKGLPLSPPFLVFTQTIQRAVALHSELRYDIPPEAGGSARIAVLHSDLSDPARSAIMAGFRRGEIWILITTDLLSRGIDFRGMNGVVNYDIPTTGASYVHRVGRTGRQGREGGVAVTLYTKDDIPYVKNIANVIAAAEKAKAKAKNGGKGNGDDGMQKWLLDALPSVSKKTKRELKQKGVESRRNPKDGARDKEKRRTRISTKSGYDRKIEHRRKGAAQGTRVRAREKSPSSEDEWGGIED